MENPYIRKEVGIRYKLIKIENIRELARYLNSLYAVSYQIYEEERKRNEELKAKTLKGEVSLDDFLTHPHPIKPECKYELIWENNRYSYNNIDIINGDFLEVRKIDSIHIQYSGINGLDIDIVLKHSHFCRATNSVTIEGYNETLISGILTQLTEMISRWETQSTWVYELKGKLFVLFSTVIIGFSFDYILLELLSWAIKINLINISVVLFSFIPSITFAFIFITTMMDKIKLLYPCIEIFTGPQHLSIEKEKRDALGKLLIIIVIPVILGLVIGLIFYVLALFTGGS